MICYSNRLSILYWLQHIALVRHLLKVRKVPEHLRQLPIYLHPMVNRHFGTFLACHLEAHQYYNSHWNL